MKLSFFFKNHFKTDGKCLIKCGLKPQYGNIWLQQAVLIFKTITDFECSQNPKFQHSLLNFLDIKAWHTWRMEKLTHSSDAQVFSKCQNVVIELKWITGGQDSTPHKAHGYIKSLTVIISDIPWTPCRSTSSARRKASCSAVCSSAISSRRSFGITISVSTFFWSFSIASRA